MVPPCLQWQFAFVWDRRQRSLPHPEGQVGFLLRYRSCKNARWLHARSEAGNVFLHLGVGMRMVLLCFQVLYALMQSCFSCFHALQQLGNHNLPVCRQDGFEPVFEIRQRADVPGHLDILHEVGFLMVDILHWLSRFICGVTVHARFHVVLDFLL